MLLAGAQGGERWSSSGGHRQNPPLWGGFVHCEPGLLPGGRPLGPPQQRCVPQDTDAL